MNGVAKKSTPTSALDASTHRDNRHSQAINAAELFFAFINSNVPYLRSAATANDFFDASQPT